MATRKLKPGESFGERHPELVAYWHYEKNGELTPKDVHAKSCKNVWWKCEYGHDWEAPVFMVSCGIFCPYDCGKRKEKP